MSRLWSASPRDHALPDKPESFSLEQWVPFTQDRFSGASKVHDLMKGRLNAGWRVPRSIS